MAEKPTGRIRTSPFGASSRPDAGLTVWRAARKDGLNLVTSRVRLASGSVLAGLKHGNRLEQVLAARDCAEQGGDEALLYDNLDRLVEAIASNLLLVIDQQCVTPLADSGVAGVGLEWLMDQAETDIVATAISHPDAARASAVMVINSVTGIRPGRSLDGRPLDIGEPCRFHAATLDQTTELTMRFLSFLLLMAAVATGVGLWQWSQWQTFVEAPVNPGSELNLWVAPGTSYAGFLKQLEVLGLSRADWRWRAWGRLHQPVLKAGEYRIEPNRTLDTLMKELASGRVREHRLTIVEGWTVDRLRHELADDPRLVSLTAELDADAMMQRLGCPGCPAEGRFLPETYFFVRGSSDEDILKRAYQALSNALDEAWAQRSPDNPIKSPDELLVLASLIERENRTANRARAGRRGFRPAPSHRHASADRPDRYLRIGRRLRWSAAAGSFAHRSSLEHLHPPWTAADTDCIARPRILCWRPLARPMAPRCTLSPRGDGTHQFSDTLEQAQCGRQSLHSGTLNERK